MPPGRDRPARVVDWGKAMNSEVDRLLRRANSRSSMIARAVTEHFYRRAVRRVCSIVEDAGGQFSGLVARTAQCKARSILLEESDSRAVINYHAIIAAREWDRGPADEALNRAVRRATRAMDTLLEDHAVRHALQLLSELTASGHPQALSPAVMENIKARVG